DGAWQRGIPAGGGTRGDPLNDFDGSGRCYLTANRAGNSDVDGGPTRLISPTLDLSGVANPVLRYARWFTNDDLDADRLDVEISNDNGGSWTLIESVPDTEGWIPREVRIADYVALTAQVKVRFSATDNPNNSVTEAALDAVKVIDISCGTVGNGDFDGDHNVDLADFATFQICFGRPAAGECAPGNLYADGIIDLKDFALFCAELEASGP
ncbi:MAG: hypothetical protein V2A79_01205, partial [Planctomycetota bacterium]